MRETSNATTRAIADKLIELRGATHWRRTCVSWPMTDGCRFAVVLGQENPPIGGVALPHVRKLTGAILRDIGVPQPENTEPAEFAGWDHTPTFDLPFGWLVGEPDQQGFRLKADVHLDSRKLQQIVNFILSAEEKTRAIASTVEETLDFARQQMAIHPSSPFVVPVGYSMLGRLDDANTFLAERRAYFSQSGIVAMVELYDRFIARLKNEHWSAWS